MRKAIPLLLAAVGIAATTYLVQNSRFISPIPPVSREDNKGDLESKVDAASASITEIKASDYSPEQNYIERNEVVEDPRVIEQKAREEGQKGFILEQVKNRGEEIGYNAGVLVKETGLDKDTALLLYNTLSAEEVAKMEDSARLVAKRVDAHLNLPTDTQFNLIKDLSSARSTFYNRSGYTQETLRDLAANNPQAFIELYGRQRREQFDALARWMNENGVKYVDAARAAEINDYMFGEMGRRHLENGIKREAEELTKAAKENKFRFKW